MGSLCMLLLGNAVVVPILVASEIAAAAGVIVFACNVFLNVQPQRAPLAPRVVVRQSAVSRS
jgi:hypothetical protein